MDKGQREMLVRHALGWSDVIRQHTPIARLLVTAVVLIDAVHFE